MIAVTALSVCPIKGTRLRSVSEVSLDAHGAAGDREFFVVDARDRMVNGKTVGRLQQVLAERSDSGLTLELPSGETVRDEVRLGRPREVRFFSRTRTVRPLEGPFSAALSELSGQPLHLVRPDTRGVDRGAQGAISLISRGSLRRLATEAAESDLDPRRFRMLIEIDGVEPHTEDGWIGRRAAVGGATVRFGGHVGRCLVTSRDPDSGEITLPTLDILRQYRQDAQTTEPLAFGVYGAVLAGGTVRIGDALELLT